MAFDQEQYGHARQNSVMGLQSSNSYLDGVPFKISPSFRPPPQPALPNELLNNTRCEALHEEYEYDTEEAVLAWARAREEAKAKAILEREATERARAALAAAAESNSSDSDEGERPEVPAHPVQTPVPPRPETVAAKPPWQLPVSSSNTILTPMRIQTAKAKVQSPLLAPHLDLALFEQEGDPFDTMELQTINDMEELRTVLSGATVGGGGGGEGAGSGQDPSSYSSSPNPEHRSNARVGEGGEEEEEEVCYSNITASSSSHNSTAALNSASVGGGGGGGVASSSSASPTHLYENVTVRPSGVAILGGGGGEQQQQRPFNNNNNNTATTTTTTTTSGMSRNNNSASSNSAARKTPDSVSTSNHNNDHQHHHNRDSGEPSFVLEPTGDGDYVQIRPDFSQQSVTFQKDSESEAPIYGNVGQGAEQELPPATTEMYANDTSVKTVLPAIRPRGHSLSTGGVGDLALEAAAAAGGQTAFQPEQMQFGQQTTAAGLGSGSGQASSDMMSRRDVMSASASGVLDVSQSENYALTNHHHHHTYSNLPLSRPRSGGEGPSPVFSNNLYGGGGGGYGNVPGESPLPSYNSVMGVGGGEGGSLLRSTKSSPDLSAASPRLLSANPSAQPWNPYKPLPPTPVSELRSSSSSTESLSNDQQLSPPAVTTTTNNTNNSNHNSNNNNNAAASSSGSGSVSQSEMDPYNSLSSDAKTFVNNLTSMGFSRSRAARAVQKFGADEREVLDHLFNVDKLVEKRFTPAQAETGLQLFKNDIQKAEQFLDLYQQFTELGFTGERIQTALVKHQLDRDKALDYLTA